ncbi:MAG: FAD-binding oxidoreductase [Candidatus Heimdallarchaeaceae archaeon]
MLVETVEDIKKAFEIANKTKIPLIPRAGATSGHGGTLVYKKGIIVDLTKLNRIIDIELMDQSVTVEPAVTFHDLEKALTMQSLALCSYPSSIYSGTIGGWIAQGGEGIGSLKYGSIIDLLLGLEVVLPNGSVKYYTEKEDFEMFVGAQGTTGIITKIKMKFRFDIPLKHIAFTFDNFTDMLKGLSRCREVEPFSVWFLNKHKVDYLNKTLGYILPSRHLVIVSKEISYDEEEKEFREKIYKIVREEKGQLISDYYIQGIWKARFKIFSILKEMDNYILGEVSIPLDYGAEYIENLPKKIDRKILIEGTMVSFSTVSIILNLVLKTDQSKIKQYKKFLKVYKWILKAIKIGGFPSATGLWFGGYYHTIYGKEREEKLLKFKKEVDKNNICNPDKVWSPKVKQLPLISLKTAIKIIDGLF